MDHRPESGALAAALRALPLQSFRSLATGVLADIAGLQAATVRLVDYPGEQLRLLSGAHAAEAVAVTGNPEGTAYREQRVVQAGTRVHVPVSCRGNRLGVLSADLDEHDEAALLEIGDVLADAFQVANIGTDQLVNARRGDRMTVAAELQWELLPGRGLHAAEFVLAGQLRPAYLVRGDNFDWSLDPGRLTLTVTNGMGEGLDAAILTSVAIAAVRNARRSGAPLAEQASLASQAIWSQYGGKQHVAVLLLTVDLADGRLSVIDAGSPRAWRQRAGELTPFELDKQLPLGMFADTAYRVQTDRLRPGDRMIMVSDGVYTARHEDRNYAEHSMPRVLHTSRGLPPAEAVRAVLSDLDVFRQHADTDDDLVVVCLDWLGPDTRKTTQS